MKCIFKLRLFFTLFVLFFFVSESLQTKKINCRKYVYAPVCRGVAAKRAISQLEMETLEKSEPSRVMEPRGIPLQWGEVSEKQGGNEKSFLKIMFPRLDNLNDYDNDNYIK